MKFRIILIFCLASNFSITYQYKLTLENNVQCSTRLTYLSAFPQRNSKSSKGAEEAFVCESCGAEHIKWVGRCTSCKEWNTVKSIRIPSMKNLPLKEKVQFTSSGNWLQKSSPRLVKMSELQVGLESQRLHTWSSEVDRVLGGGIVKGSVVLLAGEPGIGKSTLLLQLVSSIANLGNEIKNMNIVYISGEETAEQIVSRSRRLQINPDSAYILCEVDVDEAVGQLLTMETAPALVIIDSIQTMTTAESASSAGSVTQIRESTAKLLQFAKSTGCAVLLVGHVTKLGEIAGPRVLEHMVDTVLYMEGSQLSEHRILRTAKNRFGSTSEVGVLSMTAQGLVDVLNPSEVFMREKVLEDGFEGSSVAVIVEGSRPILAEIECLVGGFSMAKSPRRAADGFSLPRLQLLCAVIEKRLKLTLWNHEVYLKAVGGMRISEPAADLAAAIAIVSSLLEVRIRPSTALVGEVGLGGDLRSARQMESRILEAQKLGFQRIIVPRVAGRRSPPLDCSIQVCYCKDLREALAEALETSDKVDELLRKHRKASRRSSPSAGTNTPSQQRSSTLEEEGWRESSDDSDMEEESEYEETSFG